jgi:glycine/D-amino acid oxidase-like deaminating enzyme
MSEIARTCWWLQEAMSHPQFAGTPARKLSGDTSADVVIIGGGFTGLWTAWHLKKQDPGIDVVVLEQWECGFGASGRNGGFISGYVDQAGHLADVYGVKGAQDIVRAGDHAVASIGQWLDEQGVDAWFRPDGSMAVASSKAQLDGLDGQYETAKRLGIPERITPLTGEQVRQRCDSPSFHGGYLIHDGGTVHPARLARALRQACLDAGVRIYENTMVQPPNPDGRALVETSGGQVRAGSVVLGANAWMASWPIFKRRLVVRGTYIAITAPAPELLEELRWTNGMGICDVRSSLRYLRTTPDGRIVLGVGGQRGSFDGSVDTRFDFDETGRRNAVSAIRKFFPSFRDVPIEGSWGGPVDLPSTHDPFVGNLPGGRVHYAVGYTGHGVAPTHLMGEILASRVLGLETEHTALPFVDYVPRAWPPQPFRGVGASMVNAAVVKRDDALDDGRRVGTIAKVTTALPGMLGYYIG